MATSGPIPRTGIVYCTAGTACPIVRRSPSLYLTGVYTGRTGIRCARIRYCRTASCLCRRTLRTYRRYTILGGYHTTGRTADHVTTVSVYGLVIAARSAGGYIIITAVTFASIHLVSCREGFSTMIVRISSGMDTRIMSRRTVPSMASTPITAYTTMYIMRWELMPMRMMDMRRTSPITSISPITSVPPA